MNTPRTHVPRILLGLAFLTLACNRDDDSAKACEVSDPPQCLDAGTLEQCGPSAEWQTLSCAVQCQQTLGAPSLGCGYSTQLDSEACLCVVEDPPDSGGNTTNTTNSDSGNNDSGNSDSGNNDSGNNDSGNSDSGNNDADADGGDADADGGVPPCAPAYDGCASNGDCCGFTEGAAFCVDNGGGGTCRPVCAGDSDCGSDCCAELNNGETVCSPANFCPDDPPHCTGSGYSCDASSECCPGNTCVNFGGGDVLCAFECTYGEECNSGCCAPLEQGGGVCAPTSYCGGAPADPDMPLTANFSPAPVPTSADATLVNRPAR